MFVILVLALSACSDSAFIDLGDRSSGWIDEVATTTATTTTTTPTLTAPAADVDWVNDEFDPPDPEADPDRILAQVFARAGDASRFLQASREEIAAVTPEVAFPSFVPIEVGYVTSQLVIESRTLQLATDPTVAFGLWSVEPYTRSRSVGQVGVLSVSSVGDEEAASATAANSEVICAAISGVDRLCAVEEFAANPVWRLESETGVSHVWYSGPYRYELSGNGDISEEIWHMAISPMSPISELLPAADEVG